MVERVHRADVDEAPHTRSPRGLGSVARPRDVDRMDETTLAPGDGDPRRQVNDQLHALEGPAQALGILDVSWVHRSGPNPLEIYGTAGYLTIDTGPGPRIWLESTKIDAAGLKGPIAPSSLPPALPSPMDQWLAAIKTDAPMTITIKDGWNLTQLMEGCYTAARTGKAYSF